MRLAPVEPKSLSLTPNEILDPQLTDFLLFASRDELCAAVSLDPEGLRPRHCALRGRMGGMAPKLGSPL